MMNLIFLALGILTIVSAALLVKLSKRYRLNWIAWGGMGLGIGLILFCIAWSSASVLGGGPRAAAMGGGVFRLSRHRAANAHHEVYRCQA